MGAGEAGRGTTGTTERGVVDRLRERRERMRARPTVNLAYRIAVGVVGTAVLIVGIILIPYPGPGWLIVIAGLAILASEFERAQRALQFVKRYYDGWSSWLSRQPRWVQAVLLALTTIVVLTTLWMLGTFALVAGWVGYEAGWVRSPLLG